MHLPHFMIFGSYKLHKATNEKVLTLSLYQLLHARGCYKAEYFLCAIAVLLSINFYIWSKTTC